MKIRNLRLDDEEKPDMITVEMTRAEAILITTFVGSLKPSSAVSTDIWNALTGSVFNPYWEDGVDDARRS